MNKQIERLNYLRTMLVKYSHRYNACNSEPSQRMEAWIDEYNNLRETSSWVEYTKLYNLSVNHDAFDLFA